MSRILLIDDNEEILSINKSHLTVPDILLPDLNGFTLCKAARTITDTNILFLSCLEEADDKVNGLMAGGDDYLTKPLAGDGGK